MLNCLMCSLVFVTYPNSHTCMTTWVAHTKCHTRHFIMCVYIYNVHVQSCRSSYRRDCEPSCFRLLSDGIPPLWKRKGHGYLEELKRVAESRWFLQWRSMGKFFICCRIQLQFCFRVHLKPSNDQGEFEFDWARCNKNSVENSFSSGTWWDAQQWHWPLARGMTNLKSLLPNPLVHIKPATYTEKLWRNSPRSEWILYSNRYNECFFTMKAISVALSIVDSITLTSKCLES